ncbi:flagellar hook-length control protein [Rhodobacteraceae bacterium KLH11]|nr:flagellar hook-length control protein [Rhodobacteraceae bacterium KLH11]
MESKTDQSRAGEVKNKGAFTFADALNEGVEPQDSEETLAAAADPAELSEHSEIATDADTEAPKATQDDDPAPPQTGLLQAAEFKDNTPLPKQIASTSAPASEPMRAHQNVVLINWASENHAPARGSVPPAPVEVVHDSSATEHAHTRIENPGVRQSTGPHVLHPAPPPDTASNPAQHKAEPETRLTGEVNAPTGNKANSKPVISAAVKAMTPAQAMGWAPNEDITDSAAIPESDDLTVIKDVTTSSGQRDAMPATPTIAARAEIARAIAGQLATVISARPGAGGVEIALNPEELGRVSITLNGREDGFHLTIATERPETLDLMRRHISILSAEFEKLGYAGLTLDLGLSDGTSQQDDPSGSGHGTETSQTSDALDQHDPTLPLGPERGLDMRL